MSNEGQNLLSIPKFDGDYDHWRLLMENLLRSKEWWHLIEPGYVEPAAGVRETEAEKTAREQLKLKDLKVKNYLFSAIDKNVLRTILQKETSAQLWESLRKKYQGNAKVKRAQLQALRREFEVLEMKDGETITDYFSRVMLVVNNMSNNGEVMRESQIVEKILRTLTEKFNYIVVSIEESKDIASLSVDELQSSLVVHEQKFRKKVKEEEHVLKVTQEEGFGRGRGRNASGSYRGRGRGRSSPGKAVVECYRCHRLGHFQFECPEWGRRANFAEMDEEEELMLMAYIEHQGSSIEEVWFLDSGCSNHMSGNEEWFTDLNKNFKNTVKLGNDSRLTVTGKGNVRMKVNGVTQVITDVYYVPELKSNLLSVGQIQEKGLTILIKDNVCKVFHSRRGLIMQSEMSGNRMFYFKAAMASKTPTCYQTRIEDESQLWHSRFGHLHYKALRTLVYKGMVEGMPAIKTPQKLCSHCLIGKQHREVIPKKSSWRATEKLQLIHSDICGPVSPISSSAKRYFLSFIDDFSRKTWIYLLNEKSEAFNKFKDFKTLIEKEAGTSIKCLRTDRGGEFNSKELTEFCNEHGINRQLTTAYTPQQNGVAERKNRTIMNMVRSMLNAKQLPKEFWAEAVNWSVHILNRCPTSALDGMTPQEAWSGTKPRVDHFRVFGCLAFVHIPDQKRHKLDDKSKAHVFLGVSKESKAYRFVDPVTRKIIVSRDVKFEENESWKWEETEKEKENDVLEWPDSGPDYNDEGLVMEEADPSSPMSSGASSDNREDNSPSNTPSDSGPSSPTGERAQERIQRTSSERIRRAPARLADYVAGDELSEEEAMMVRSDDPLTYDEAVKDLKWRDAMMKEMESIKKNGTWELTNLPEGWKAVGTKWIFKTKLNENGEIEKHKARLVAKGYSQKYGIDYTEVFAPVARLDTIRAILATAAQKDWEVFQMDVKSAFLQGNLEEEVFVQQPTGFEVKGAEDKVYKLHKALYGLKQAPRAWYSRIESYFIKEGFKRCASEHTLFTREKEGDILIVSLYVDDLIYTGSSRRLCEEFKSSMMAEFDMSDLGKMKHFLGMEVLQNNKGIFICQRRYAKEVLEKFGMENSNPVGNPIVPGTRIFNNREGTKVDSTKFKQIVGSLMYLTATRPDITYAVSLISRYMESPTEEHWCAAKRILRYIQGTTDLGVLYKREENSELVAYSDSDFAGDLDDRKSTSGSVFLLAGGAISWSSKKQPVVTLSTTEAEYIAAAACACQFVWLRRILIALGHREGGSNIIQCDNSSTIQLSKHPVFHGKSKHIDIKFHFLRDLVSDGTIQLSYCSSQEQVADVMTKPLKKEQFVKLRGLLGLVEISDVS